MKLLISIHDVAPPFEREVRWLWDVCRSLDTIPALLVVPDWHGKAPLIDARSLVRWAADAECGGASVLLHGLRHDEAGMKRRILQTVRAAGRTAREGEFRTLDYAAAHRRIREGLTALRESGLHPIGFVPPAWLAGPATRRAVRDAGLALTEDASHVWLTHCNVPLVAPAVRWSTRSALRAAASALIADARWRWQRNAGMVRLALHPADVHSALTRRSLVRSLERWRAQRTPISYASLAAQDIPGFAA